MRQDDPDGGGDQDGAARVVSILQRQRARAEKGPGLCWLLTSSRPRMRLVDPVLAVKGRRQELAVPFQQMTVVALATTLRLGLDGAAPLLPLTAPTGRGTQALRPAP